MKLNIAELLKDCPSGMELDCVTYDNVSFDKVSDDKKSAYPIFCYITDEKGNRSGISFTENGCESKRYGAKCVIFPKGKTTWEGFQRPFKDGDVVVCKENEKITQMFILKSQTDEKRGYCYTGYDFRFNEFFEAGKWYFDRLATEEEKKKLFDAIKANGYKWNAETKTLEKLIIPKFKVGDKVKVKNGVSEFRIIDGVFDTFYSLQMFGKLDFTDQDNWELVSNKFDITTLKPFESRVLIRDCKSERWYPAIWGLKIDDLDYPYIVISGQPYKFCIPYEGNQHLLGTTNDCDDYYKTW